LAASILELARRLDEGPGDREAASLARELRLGLAELWRRAPVLEVEEVPGGRVAALGDS
jgi:hypothetical protein